MNKSKVIKRFVELTYESMPTNFRINAGGCGIYAIECAKVLKEHFGIETQYYFLPSYSGKTEPKIVKTCLHEVNNVYKPEETSLGFIDRKFNIGCAHIVLKFKGTFFDYKTISKSIPDFKFSSANNKNTHEIKEEVLISCLEHESEWNDTFNRRNIPQIKEILLKVAETVKTEIN